MDTSVDENVETITNKADIGGGQEETVRDDGGRHKNLVKARKDKESEFYTRFDDIEKEILSYDRSIFKGKTVLCNCNDFIDRNFYRFFKLNFEYLGLERLICTQFKGDASLGADGNKKSGKNKVSEELVRGIETYEDRAWKIEYRLKHGEPMYSFQELKQRGYFASDEMIHLMGTADIVITNPPFGLFRQYIQLVNEMHKKFIILGNINAAQYSDVFRLIKNDKLRLGISIRSGGMTFEIPDSYSDKTSNEVKKDGKSYINVSGVRWYTNIEHGFQPDFLELYKLHDIKYEKYDDYDAINVDKVSLIPDDYYKEIAVPVTFLDKYNNNQFELVGMLKFGNNNDVILSDPVIGGTKKYTRIIIKRKDVKGKRHGN